MALKRPNIEYRTRINPGRSRTDEWLRSGEVVCDNTEDKLPRTLVSEEHGCASPPPGVNYDSDEMQISNT